MAHAIRQTFNVLIDNIRLPFIELYDVDGHIEDTAFLSILADFKTRAKREIRAVESKTQAVCTKPVSRAIYTVYRPGT